MTQDHQYLHTINKFSMHCRDRPIVLPYTSSQTFDSFSTWPFQLFLLVLDLRSTCIVGMYCSARKYPIKWLLPLPLNSKFRQDRWGLFSHSRTTKSGLPCKLHWTIVWSWLWSFLPFPGCGLQSFLPPKKVNIGLHTFPFWCHHLCHLNWCD